VADDRYPKRSFSPAKHSRAQLQLTKPHAGR
jgi:hypothetical protein